MINICCPLIIKDNINKNSIVSTVVSNELYIFQLEYCDICTRIEAKFLDMQVYIRDLDKLREFLSNKKFTH